MLTGNCGGVEFAVGDVGMIRMTNGMTRMFNFHPTGPTKPRDPPPQLYSTSSHHGHLFSSYNYGAHPD